MNYEKDIRIDETALDVEWLEQPSLMLKYIKHSAQAEKELDEAKQTLDVVRAEVDSAIRKNPEGYGLSKVTDASIASTLIIQEEYKIAFENFLEVKYEASMAKGAIKAFEQRKESLENLVKLHGQSYFAGPKIPRDIHWEREQKQKKVDSGISRNFKREK